MNWNRSSDGPTDYTCPKPNYKMDDFQVDTSSGGKRDDAGNMIGGEKWKSFNQCMIDLDGSGKQDRDDTSSGGDWDGEGKPGKGRGDSRGDGRGDGRGDESRDGKGEWDDDMGGDDMGGDEMGGDEQLIIEMGDDGFMIVMKNARGLIVASATTVAAITLSMY